MNLRTPFSFLIGLFASFLSCLMVLAGDSFDSYKVINAATEEEFGLLDFSNAARKTGVTRAEIFHVAGDKEELIADIRYTWNKDKTEFTRIIDWITQGSKTTQKFKTITDALVCLSSTSNNISFEMEYDDKGHKIRQTAIGYGPNGKPMETGVDIHLYDEQGNLVESREQINGGGETLASTYSYQTDGEWSITVELSPSQWDRTKEGSRLETRERYNTGKQPVERIVAFTSDGTKVSTKTTVWEYTNKGFLAKTTQTAESLIEQLTITKEYEYTDNRLTRIVICEKGKKMGKNLNSHFIIRYSYN